VVCEHCNAHFSVALGGRSDINQHLRSQKHKDAEKTLASLKNISLFMVRCDGDSESNKIAASEAHVLIILCITVKVFGANDCLSTLIKNIYEPKFSSACTTSEAVITSDLSPYILGEVIEDLNKIKSITLSLDALNKKDIKLFPIVVQYILPNVVFKTKL
jgi:hypothetical protein